MPENKRRVLYNISEFKPHKFWPPPKKLQKNYTSYEFACQVTEKAKITEKYREIYSFSLINHILAGFGALRIQEQKIPEKRACDAKNL